MLLWKIPESGYGIVKAYEPHTGGHIVKNDFGDSFWPLDIGSTYTTGSKSELLLLRGENAEMWLTPVGGNYPCNINDSLVIVLDTGISGGVMADYDNDNKTEILMVKNLPAERVIQAYKDYPQVSWLQEIQLAIQLKLRAVIILCLLSL